MTKTTKGQRHDAWRKMENAPIRRLKLWNSLNRSSLSHTDRKWPAVDQRMRGFRHNSETGYDRGEVRQQNQSKRVAHTELHLQLLLCEYNNISVGKFTGENCNQRCSFWTTTEIGAGSSACETWKTYQSTHSRKNKLPNSLVCYHTVRNSLRMDLKCIVRAIDAKSTQVVASIPKKQRWVSPMTAQ